MKHSGESSAADAHQNKPLWSRDSLKGDFLGALSALLVSLPLSMTIGVIAFAPLGSEYIIQGVMAGVFGAATLSVVSAFFGARTPLISGPRAATALIVASLITNLLVSEDLFFPSGETVGHVIAITFFAILLAGIIQAVAGATRLANIIKFIPYPVVSAFVNSSALLIISGQAWILLDVRKEKSFIEEENFFDLLMRIGEAQPLSMIAPAATIITMLLVAKYLRLLPASLIGMLVGTGVYYGLGEMLGGVDIGATLGNIATNSTVVGNVDVVSTPAYLPILQFPGMFTSITAGGDLWATLMIVIPAALAMAALASLDTAVALTAVDGVNQSRTDVNREVMGQGAGNMATALLGGLIGSGGMVSTMPALQAGGRTQAVALISSVLMVMAVVLFAGLIDHIPRSVIAGIIVVLGLQIFDPWSLTVLRGCMSRYAFKRSGVLLDGIIIFLVVLVALSVDLIAAVGVGILLSVIVFVSRMSRSLIRSERRGPSIHARSVWNQTRQQFLEQHGHQIAVLELDGAIFFGTADGLEARICLLIDGGVRFVVLDLKRIRDIDSTGAFVLERIKKHLERKNGAMVCSYVLKERRQSRNDTIIERRESRSQRDIWSFLNHSGALDRLGESTFFPDTDHALAHCEDLLISQVHEEEGGEFSNQQVKLPAIFNNLSDDEIRLLRKMVTRHTFETGEHVFRQGDDGDALYFISRGRGEVLVHLLASGEKKRLESLLRGAIFGEMALLDSKPRAASVIAAEKMVCYRLGVDAFDNVKQSHRGMAIKLFNSLCIMLSERVRSANAMIAELEK